LTSIAIGSKVETIGYTAFYHCSSLISIIVPNSVTYVGPWTFYGCSALISATIGDHLASISNRMFAECKSLSYVTIGSGVTSIEEAAFYNCTSLTSLVFLGLHAPTSVAETWIWVVNEGIKGHAYATSNFPSPGGVWNRLTMGEVYQQLPCSRQSNCTPESTHAVLVWMAPSNNGGKNITSYRVYRNDSVNSTFVLIGSSTELNYIDKGLAYGLTYWYKVSAVNSMGEGANCSSVSSIVYQPIVRLRWWDAIMIVAIIVVGAILAVLFVMRGRNRKA